MSRHQSSLKVKIFQQCLSADRAALLRLLKKTSGQYNEALEKAIEESIHKRETRASKRPRANFNADLPFGNHIEELSDAILNNQVVIVCGETGSGKTTQLPQLCIDLGLADAGLIGHTQPRRIAAQAVCSRIAEELKTEVGTAVGYKIRFQDRSSDSAYIKLMTDGILLAETQSDRWLNRYATLIIDEAHERSLNIDLLLGFIKQLLPRRPDLKLIVTSATIDPQCFATYFNDAPILNISGRSYAVEMRYRPANEDDRDNLQILCDAVEELDAVAREDMLVFFPGERQIREAEEKLGKKFSRDYDILPLYARLNAAEQRRIFQAHSKRRIVLATNVAETSLTVPGIRYVIDTGLARLSRYSWRARVQRLPIEKISQASANQRSGRCGRLAPGICIRLYDEEDFTSRAKFTEAEILRSNLASVILQMNDLKLGTIHEFDFIESPDSRLINDGYRLLFELGATDNEDRILKHGHRIAGLPLDPRLAHMLIRAQTLNCLNEMLIIVSALSVQDPRSAAEEKRQAANEKYQLWQNNNSDFLFWIALWKSLAEQRAELSRNQFSRWCRKHYLSYSRLREWQDIYQQLNQQLKSLKYRFNTTEAEADSIHRCIFSGIPSHIASFDKDTQFQATRGRRLRIFPASTLAKQTPKWIMAFSLIETRQLYAHAVARFNPQWAMQDASQLHQYEYYEPHWQSRQGRVAAFRNTRIYGLLIEGGKRINFAAIEPKQSRQIFIQNALVEGDYVTRIEVIIANRKLVEHYRQQEDKYRRRDILLSDRLLYEFYDTRLPAEAVDAPSFEAWVKQQSSVQIDNLRFLASDIADDSVDAEKVEGFPELIELRDQTLKLDYLFEPGNEFDGVTVALPLALLNQFKEADFDRLVPGLLPEKVEALIRSLPRKLRKNFVPVNEFTSACMQRMDTDADLLVSIQQSLRAMTGVTIDLDEWRGVTLETHFQMHYALYDGKSCIARSHNLVELQQQFGEHARTQFEHHLQHHESLARSGLDDWDFDRLPEHVTLQPSGQSLRAYPALVDYEDSVAIELFETRADADFYHASGIARLFYLQLDDSIKYLNKNLPRIEQTALMYSAMGTRTELLADLIMATVFSCFLDGELPQSREEFNDSLQENHQQFVSTANKLAELVHQVLALKQDVRSRLDSLDLPEVHRDDITEQLQGLIYPEFIRDIPTLQLSRLPAYLQGILRRMQNFKPGSQRLNKQLETIQVYQQQYQQFYQQECYDYQKLDALRWMIEEFRIGCFAQPMKTRFPVSEKKIEKHISTIEVYFD
ncbi:MAG: ATP-dependent RNA helicase HrpA [Gammaproteobacteria bacterium]|nr:ATP-dependent RNA helicase HrpA [Gammaproteobacteria bacterium]